MEDWKGKIKEKDLEQLAVVKAFRLEYLVALDRDFQPFPEYCTPKKFLKKQGIPVAASEC